MARSVSAYLTEAFAERTESDWLKPGPPMRDGTAHALHRSHSLADYPPRPFAPDCETCGGSGCYRLEFFVTRFGGYALRWRYGDSVTVTRPYSPITYPGRPRPRPQRQPYDT